MVCSAFSFGSLTNASASNLSSVSLPVRLNVPAIGLIVVFPFATFSWASGEDPNSLKSPKSK
jgi:hypothetical protein